MYWYFRAGATGGDVGSWKTENTHSTVVSQKHNDKINALRITMFFTILPFYGGSLIYQSLVRELKKNPQNLPEKDNDVPPCSCLSLKKSKQKLESRENITDWHHCSKKDWVSPRIQINIQQWPRPWGDEISAFSLMKQDFMLPCLYLWICDPHDAVRLTK